MNEFYDYVITKPELEDALAHYGVKGMRWGHRKNKYTNADGSLNKRGQKKKALLESYKKRDIARAKRNIDSETKSYQKGVKSSEAAAVVARAKAESNRKIADYAKTTTNTRGIKRTEKQALRSEKKADRKEKAAYNNKEAMKDIHSGNRKYIQNIERHYDSKISALSNPDIKKSDYYKQTKKDYNEQRYWDLNYGSGMSRLNEAEKQRNKRRKK